VGSLSVLFDNYREDSKDARHQEHRDQHLGEHQRYPRNSAPRKKNARRAIERDWPCCSQYENLSDITISSGFHEYAPKMT
jgi:hypothetical protein